MAEILLAKKKIDCSHPTVTQDCTVSQQVRFCRPWCAAFNQDTQTVVVASGSLRRVWTGDGHQWHGAISPFNHFQPADESHCTPNNPFASSPPNILCVPSGKPVLSGVLPVLTGAILVDQLRLSLAEVRRNLYELRTHCVNLSLCGHVRKAVKVCQYI